MFVYKTEKVMEARRLSEAGMSDYAVARATGVTRQTVFRWRHHGFERVRGDAVWIVEGAPYAYLLGLYLGDGYLSKGPRAAAATLDIACDPQYVSVLEEASHAIASTFPGPPVRRHAIAGGNCVRLRITHPALVSAFPQHAPGKKHQRRIALEAWQLAITERHTPEFLRGLIHSDGSRCINRFKTRLPSGRVAAYEYVRYFFTNYSADIRRLFCEHCDLLGIEWTQSNTRNISIARRDSVDLLDQMVGPKA